MRAPRGVPATCEVDALVKDKPQVGRPSLFNKKTCVIHARVSSIGESRREELRSEISDIVGWPLARISDGDVVEYSFRGKKASIEHWKHRGII